MRPAPDRSSTGAVVVTHEPAGAVASRIRAMAALADRALVVDNGTRTAARAELESLVREGAVDFLGNEANLGVAAALNQGCAWAEGRGYGWVLLFDQDSVPRPDLLERMAEVYADHPARDRIAVIGANHRDPASGRAARSARGRADASWLEAKTVVTSGSLLALDVFRAIGPFRADLFIDEVDHEYCLRARARGFGVILTRDVLLAHGPGRVTRERLAGRAVHPTHHAPARWYFMTRNLVVLAREYGGREPAWVLAAILHRMKMTVKMLLFEESRRAKLACAGQGILDGLRNRLGPWRAGR